MAKTAPVTLAELNAATDREFVALVGPVVEHSPWVAEKCLSQRPFASVDDLASALGRHIAAAPVDIQEDLFRMHPELAGAEAVAGSMTDSSTSEQGRLGLAALDASEFERLGALNRRHREKFGYPCIIAVRLHATRGSLFDAFEKRLANAPDAERQATLDQIREIVRGRLQTLIAPEGWLSTHVLDTATGLPAAGMAIDLMERWIDGWRMVKSVRSNAQGRTDEPLLAREAMRAGVYRLQFHAGDYYRTAGVTMSDPPFLDRVPLEFGISDTNAHYHIPLLCTPWSYATYRGS